ncbi:RNA polymerase factor sigma-54 [Pseudahrensia aquimaris]|uniref:RNA polymerase sigma-54 factor n=1 Tax=Pseudahrensia aquimaris TaxID=744461 RepID=A0ABW3FF74_9HYPH
MGLAQKLVQRQSQSLVMTPQLSQSIKLLAMSNVELSSFIEDELERNPFLERDSRPDGEAQDARNDGVTDAKPDEKIRDLTAQNDLEISAAALEENLGTRIENVFPDEQDYTRAERQKPATDDLRLSPSGLAMSSNGDAHDRSVSDFSADTKTLNQHLLEQASMAQADTTCLFIVKDLIENLDDAGYLDCTLDEVVQRLSCSEDQAQSALSLLQSFEPAGVGARNLAECLALQLREKNRLDPAMQTVLDNLNLLAKRDFATLAKLSGLDMSDLRDCVEEIRACDPKPGTAFEATPMQHISADVFVRASHDGSWQIELNSETLPRVLVNETYVTAVSSKLGGSDERGFVADCLQTASWLTKSLDQRAKTILKVAGEIVRHQDGFMVHGVSHLKPLTLKEVAEAIEMHESTVSRVTSNKYMMTPRGLFELKYFFTTGLSDSDGGETHSSAAVRDQIRRMIDAESAKTVLSDDAIVEALKASGIEIARRTVAKYRDAMHIPSSVQRRREKRVQESVG